jgi:hypothetical protein
VDPGGVVVVLPVGVELGGVEVVVAGVLVVVWGEVVGGLEVVPAGVVEVCAVVVTMGVLETGVVLVDGLAPEHPASMTKIVTMETSNKELAFIFSSKSMKKILGQ